MRYLLDTHSFLWFIMGDGRLSTKARSLMEDPGVLKLLSAASLWEMAIKTSLGKLKLEEPFEVLMPQQISANGIEVLPIQIPHFVSVAYLPFHHRDPFDRMLIAQAKVEGLTVIGNDSAWDAYGVNRAW